ncbi:family 78 glycoside hydrolase catalytic domain, partial [Clostridioides difficile]|nr:family 78 glycoside hydrolase catalytic domain [Clostridioides difficile]
FKVRGRTGEEVRFQCFEMLDSSGNVYTANLRSAKQEIRYICRGEGEENYHPHFTFQGFRYVHVLDWPGELKEEDVAACVLHSDMEETGEFSCSNPLVNQLHSNIKWSMKGNFL